MSKRIIFSYTQEEALRMFEEDPWDFRKDLLSILHSSEGVFFELNFTDPMDPFRIDLHETDLLPSFGDFSTYIQELEKCPSKKASVSFVSPNTKTDLVIPCNTTQNYGHFLNFLRKCSKNEWKNLWKEVAFIVREKGKSRIWTHGLSVPWLHIRIT